LVVDLTRILDCLVEGVCVLDVSGRVVLASRAAQRMLGLRAADLIGAGWSELGLPLPPGFPPAASSADRPVAFPPIECAVSGPQGQSVHLSVTVVPLGLGGGQWAVVLRDASAEHELRLQLARSEKLSTIGELAAGVVHEIRGPLQALLCGIRTIADTSDVDRGVIEAMSEEVMRLDGVARRLLDFARTGDLRPQLVEAAELADRLVLRVAQTCREASVELSVEAEDDLPQVEVDATYIEHALVNIALNAVAAMPDGGALAVRLYGRTRGGRGRGGGRGASGGGRPGVALSVSDTGCGMDEATLARVFEPLFSGRPGGTGLGLAMANRFVKAHGGVIEVESVVGEGSTFTVWLPSVEEEGTEGLEAVEGDPRLLRSSVRPLP